MNLFLCCAACGGHAERRSPRQRYCPDCRKDMWYRAQQERREMKNANKPQPTIICIDCNKTVLRTGSRQKRCFDCRMIEEDRLRRDCKYRNAVKRGIIKNPGTRSRRNDSANLEKPK